MEVFVTGYCRCLDKSRIVLVEDGAPDCEFFSCPYAAACELGKRIGEIIKDQT